MTPPRYKNRTNVSVSLDSDTLRRINAIIRNNTTLSSPPPNRSEVIRAAVAALYESDKPLSEIQLDLPL